MKNGIAIVLGIVAVIGIGAYIYNRNNKKSVKTITKNDGSKTIRIGEDAQQDIVDEGVDSISAIMKTEMSMNFTEYTNMGGGKSFYRNDTEEKLNMGGGKSFYRNDTEEKLNMGGSDSFYLNEENYSADGDTKESSASSLFKSKELPQGANVPTKGKGRGLGIGSMLQNKGAGSGLVTGTHLLGKYQTKGMPSQIFEKLQDKHKGKILEKRADKLERLQAISNRLDSIESKANPDVKELLSTIRARVNGLAMVIANNYSKEQKDKVLAFLYEIQSDPKLRTTLVSKAINENKEIGDVMMEEATANIENNVNFDGPENWTNADGAKYWGVVGLWDGDSKGTKKSYVSQPYSVDFNTGNVQFTGTLSNDRTWANCCGG